MGPESANFIFQSFWTAGVTCNRWQQLYVGVVLVVHSLCFPKTSSYSTGGREKHGNANYLHERAERAVHEMAMHLLGDTLEVSV